MRREEIQKLMFIVDVLLVIKICKFSDHTTSYTQPCVLIRVAGVKVRSRKKPQVEIISKKFRKIVKFQIENCNLHCVAYRIATEIRDHTNNGITTNVSGHLCGEL